MKLNLNDRVRLTLTEAGANYLNGVEGTKHARFRLKNPYQHEEPTTFQLWELMNLLGPRMGMATEQLVERNEIEIVHLAPKVRG